MNAPLARLSASLSLAATLWAAAANARAGEIFVTNGSPQTVGAYTTSGATVNSSLITGLNDPLGIAVSGGDLFVANYLSGTIGEYTTSGATVNATLVTGLTYLTGVAVSAGDLFVTDSNGIGEYTTSAPPSTLPWFPG